jgi:signal transduction histidine kinase/ligand-binding sensor domain-containing protein
MEQPWTAPGRRETRRTSLTAPPASGRELAAAGWVLRGALLLALVAPSPLSGQDRVVRTFDQGSGLDGPPVGALAQDSTGFIWVGGQGGLFRFDGEEFRRWAPEVVPGPVTSVTVSPNGRVAAVGGQGLLFEVTPQGAEPVPLPGVPVPNTAHALAFDEEEVLWALTGSGVAYRESGEGWRHLPAQALGPWEPRLVKPHSGGGIAVATTYEVWTARVGESPERVGGPVSRDEALADLITSPPDDVTIALQDGTVMRFSEAKGDWAPLSRPLLPGRAVSLAEREGTIWLAVDRYLIALPPDRPPDVLGQTEGIESGGPLLVDREGSLWLGSFVGLHQLPEPDTRLWSEPHGVPSRHVRRLARTGDALWILTWSGPGVFYRHEGDWKAAAVDWDSRGSVCTDAAGKVWTSSSDGIVSLYDTVATHLAWPRPDPGTVYGCTVAPEGGIWFGTRSEMGYLDPPSGRIRLVPLPPGSPRDDGVVAALHDSRDRLWLVTRDRICHAPAHVLLASDEHGRTAAEAWACEDVPGLDRVVQIVEHPDGTLWASSQRIGVLARSENEGWEELPMEGLPTRSVLSLVPSPRGGVWIAGHGILQRVRPTEGPGWQLVERLGRWHGLPATSGGDVVEEADGTVWVASARGVFQVPGHVRLRAPRLPPVALVDARVDDEPVSLDGSLELPFSRNRIELRFAALTYRDRSRLRHQVRLGPEGTWTEWRGEPAFRWVDLSPGTYGVEYRASLDGDSWAVLEEPFTFHVLPPWYRTWWFLLGVGALLGGLAWMAYRARVAYLLGLERQRTRIAMDLHDEVGSGLASVGILSGVLAADSLDEEERRSAAVEIARAAEELGYSLSDIVWSLDPGAASLKELAGRLAEHGARLFAEEEVDFTTRFPASWPRAAPSLEVRRNVLLIGFEALHNAARHAHARKVELSLRPAKAGLWELAVRDDGTGIDGDGVGQAGGNGSGARGRGIPGMWTRAEEIGGTLELTSRPGGGTEVQLRFRPRSASAGRNGRVGGFFRHRARDARRMIMRVRGER